MVVTYTQLVEILEQGNKGAKLAALLTRTSPKLTVKSRATGTPCPWPSGISRLALRSVVLGASYEAAVNRQRLAENADAEYFEAQALWGGKGVRHSTYIVQHSGNGRLYFNVRPSQHAADTVTGSVVQVARSEWTDEATGTTLDFEKDRLADYLPLSYKSNTQDVEQDVAWRTIALDNVIEVRYGDVYTLQH